MQVHLSTPNGILKHVFFRLFSKQFSKSGSQWEAKMVSVLAMSIPLAWSLELAALGLAYLGRGLINYDYISSVPLGYVTGTCALFYLYRLCATRHSLPRLIAENASTREEIGVGSNILVAVYFLLPCSVYTAALLSRSG